MNIVGMLGLIPRRKSLRNSEIEILLVSAAFIDQQASDSPFLIIGLIKGNVCFFLPYTSILPANKEHVNDM